MTDAFTMIDGALWTAALVLGAYATWLSRPREPDWEPDAFFAAVWATMLRPAPLPLAEGPIPEGGWTGEVADLGESYDPERRIGPAARWADLPAWGEDLEALVRRRLSHVSVVWLGAPAVHLPGVVVRVAPDLAALEATLDAALPTPDARVILASRDFPGELLRRLHAEPGLRDRTRAVLFVGARFSPERAWLESNFTHVAFDLELARVLSILVLRDEAAETLRSPPATTRDVVRVVDMGRVPPDVLPDATLARALALTLAALES